MIPSTEVRRPRRGPRALVGAALVGRAQQHPEEEMNPCRVHDILSYAPFTAYYRRAPFTTSPKCPVHDILSRRNDTFTTYFYRIQEDRSSRNHRIQEDRAAVEHRSRTLVGDVLLHET